MSQQATFGSTKLIYLGGIFVLIALWAIVLNIAVFREHGIIAIILCAVLVFGICHILSLSKTVINDQGIDIYRGFRVHHYSWDEIAGLTIARSGKVFLIHQSASHAHKARYRLPGVGPKDIPAIVQLSPRGSSVG